MGRLFCLHLQHCLTQEDCLLFVFFCEGKTTAEAQANRSSRELCHHPSCRRLLFIPLIALACDTTTPWVPTPDKQRTPEQMLPVRLPSRMAVLSSTSSAEPCWHTPRCSPPRLCVAPPALCLQTHEGQQGHQGAAEQH